MSSFLGGGVVIGVLKKDNPGTSKISPKPDNWPQIIYAEERIIKSSKHLG